MKQIIIISLVITTIVLAQNALAQRCPPNCPLVEKRLVYEITAQRIGSGDILEFTPMKIEFTLKVKTIGVTGTEPVPVDIAVCSAVMPQVSDFQCSRIPKAQSGNSYKRTITVPAPQAGKQSPLRIVALKPTGGEDYGQIGTPAADTIIPVDTFARYDVSIAKFEVLSTRSKSEDTVWLTLQGLVKSVPPHPSENAESPQYAGFNWLVFNQKHENQKKGNVGDGTHIVNNVRVGPFELMPEREQDLRILFYLNNVGDNKTELNIQALFPKIGVARLKGQDNTAAAQLDNLMQKFHSNAIGSCDGKLASDTVIFNNKTLANQSQNTLDAFTRKTGVFINTVPKIYREKDTDLICYQGGGQYKVTYAVYRTSWKDWGFSPRWEQ